MSQHLDDRQCPCCGAKKTRRLVSIKANQIINSSPYYGEDSYKRLSISPSEEFSIVECNTCHMVYSAAVPSASFLAALYCSIDSSNSAENIAVFARPDRISQQLRVYAHLIDVLSRLISLDSKGIPVRPLRILDVGCGYGAGLLCLSRLNYPYKVTGIEINSDARAYLSENSIECFSTLNEIPSGRLFDGIVLNDILEHVADPGTLLRQLCKVSDQNTVLYVNVPDYSAWRLKKVIKQIQAGGNVESDMNPWEHLSYFSPQSLTDIMLRNGWRRAKSESESYQFFRQTGLLSISIGMLRLIRDWYRFHRNNWPAGYSTHGVFYAVEAILTRPKVFS